MAERGLPNGMTPRLLSRGLAEYSTLSEIADQLHFSERKLRRIIRQRDIPVLEAGRDIRFDDRALIALEEALRRPCRSASTAVKAAPITKSMSRSRGNAYEEARRLLTEDLPENRQPQLRPISSAPRGTASVVALDHSRKPSSAT